jgi:hypothetical protein
MDMSDEQILALLDEVRGAVTDVDPVPDDVITAAKASLTWRTIDAELAELVEDSALAPTAGVRADAGPRLLTFEAATVTVVVEVTEVGEYRRMLGQLIGPQPERMQVQVRHAGGSLTVPVDEVGRFTADAVSAGPVSLLCQAPGAEPVATSWVTL